jgi:hypothetical protein
MMRTTLISTLSLGLLLAVALPASGQELTADVETWTGDSRRLSQVSLEVFYTILPQPAEGTLPDAPDTAGPSNGLGIKNVALFGSTKALSQAFGKGPEPLSGRRQSDVVPLHKDGVETRVQFSRIETLLFARQPVRQNPLPPYVAPTHFRHSATAILTDGTRLEADYVNLGTAVLRGTTAEGRIDIPWDQIAVIRFRR